MSTLEEVISHQAEIRAFFRTWVESMFGNSTKPLPSCPIWLDSSEYEVLHQCIREAFEMILEKKAAYAPKRSS